MEKPGENFNPDPTYFGPLVKHFSDDAVARAFYDYLMAIDLTGFNLTMDRPLTEAYQAIRECTVPVAIRFLKDYIDEMEEDEIVVPSNTFFASFQMWLVQTNTKSDMNNKSFAKSVAKYLNNSKEDLNKVRTTKVRKTIINRNRVIETFKAKKLYLDDYF